MFGFFDLFMKRINDQAAKYAAAQSDIARRAWGDWTDPFHVLQPIKVSVDRRASPGTPRRVQAGRREPF